MKSAAIGFRMHSGWGAMVTVSNDPEFEVVDRRKIVVAVATVPGSKQPYHYVEKLALNDAENHLAKCRSSAAELARAAIRESLSNLKDRGYQIAEAAVLMASGRALPTLEQILASHALIHTAEGEFFRNIIMKACQNAGIAVTPLPERELDDRAALVLESNAGAVKRKIAGLGKRLGPPWTQDEKSATLAATLILGI